MWPCARGWASTIRRLDLELPQGVRLADRPMHRHYAPRVQSRGERAGRERATAANRAVGSVGGGAAAATKRQTPDCSTTAHVDAGFDCHSMPCDHWRLAVALYSHTIGRARHHSGRRPEAMPRRPPALDSPYIHLRRLSFYGMDIGCRASALYRRTWHHGIVHATPARRNCKRGSLFACSRHSISVQRDVLYLPCLQEGMGDDATPCR